MLLVAGKKMAGWSEVKKESGSVPAAEVAPYVWAHRFLPQEAAELCAASGDANALGKSSLPWLHLVASYYCAVPFAWSGDIMMRFKGNRRVVDDRAFGQGGFRCVVAKPHVTAGTQWFELRIDNPGPNRYLFIGWAPPNAPDERNSYYDERCSAWCVQLTHGHTLCM